MSAALLLIGQSAIDAQHTDEHGRPITDHASFSLREFSTLIGHATQCANLVTTGESFSVMQTKSKQQSKRTIPMFHIVDHDHPSQKAMLAMIEEKQKLTSKAKSPAQFKSGPHKHAGVCESTAAPFVKVKIVANHKTAHGMAMHDSLIAFLTTFATGNSTVTKHVIEMARPIAMVQALSHLCQKGPHDFAVDYGFIDDTGDLGIRPLLETARTHIHTGQEGACGVEWKSYPHGSAGAFNQILLHIQKKFATALADDGSDVNESVAAVHALTIKKRQKQQKAARDKAAAKAAAAGKDEAGSESELDTE